MSFTDRCLSTQQDKLSKVQLEESWKRSLTPFLLSPYMDSLRDFLFQ
ncbi:uracil-DNA glycosylase, partial [Acinetobacter baumannii]|nr:uracil-DNA glycosylase [Acinetobacter baumannii]